MPRVDFPFSIFGGRFSIHDFPFSTFDCRFAYGRAVRLSESAVLNFKSAICPKCSVGRRSRGRRGDRSASVCVAPTLRSAPQRRACHSRLGHARARAGRPCHVSVDLEVGTAAMCHGRPGHAPSRAGRPWHVSTDLEVGTCRAQARRYDFLAAPPRGAHFSKWGSARPPASEPRVCPAFRQF